MSAARAATVIDAARATFEAQKNLAERAMAQLDDAQLHQAIAPGMNPIAVIIRHMAGNMRSRWTDFLTTDGEKPTRDRDDEFVSIHADRAALLAQWEHGWRALFGAIDALTDVDLGRTITIRGQPHTVARAILRQVDHYGYHVGQIVTFARILADDAWEHLSVPPGPGQTEAFNRRLGYDPRA